MENIIKWVITELLHHSPVRNVAPNIRRRIDMTKKPIGEVDLPEHGTYIIYDTIRLDEGNSLKEILDKMIERGTVIKKN